MSQESIIRSVEDQYTQAIGPDPSDEDTDASGNMFSWMVRSSELLPPWWSTTRDTALAGLWRKYNHLSIAIYNAQAKIVGIPPKVVARDTTNTDHVAQAEAMTQFIRATAGFGRGWDVEYAKWVEAILTQDNGAFMEIIAGGRADGPIVGMPHGVRYLDSSRCTRTSNPEFPVVYSDERGGKWKLHWTRVIYSSQMPSGIEEMNGVGFCAVSRAFDIAQSLNDMLGYKLERLGSRPQNQILLGKGITGEQIMRVLRVHEESLSARGFSNYATTVAVGSENTEIGIEKIDLTHMEPFSEEVSTNLGMFAIAAAIGMDADELWPVGGKSAGKAEANIRRMRSRGRLPAQITSDMAWQFNFKFLPPHLEMTFDFRDDEEDMQRANIRDIRGRNRERDIGTGSINIRASRTRMLNDGDVDRPTFAQMELSDGRLADGRPISVLFFSDMPVYKRLLSDVLENPLSITDNIFILDEFGDRQVDDEKLDGILSIIQTQKAVILSEWASTKSGRKAGQIEESYHAIDWLEEQYLFAAGKILPEVPMQQRRSRTDIRVKPDEASPEDVSAAGAENRGGENVQAPGNQ